MKPKQSFLATAVREFYTNLSKVKHDDTNLLEALKFAKRCHDKYVANDFLKAGEPSKKSFRESRRTKKPKSP